MQDQGKQGTAAFHCGEFSYNRTFYICFDGMVYDSAYNDMGQKA